MAVTWKEWHFARKAFSLLLDHDGAYSKRRGCIPKLVPLSRCKTLNVSRTRIGGSEIVPPSFSAVFLCAKFGWQQRVERKRSARVRGNCWRDGRRCYCRRECGRWWRSGRGDGVWDCRKISERLNISSAWKISEEFAVVLEEFESAVSGAVEVFRVTVFILRETLTRTRTVSSGLSEGVKILRLVLKLEGRPQGSAN